jgi:hypothetical protein
MWMSRVGARGLWAWWVWCWLHEVLVVLDGHCREAEKDDSWVFVDVEAVETLFVKIEYEGAWEQYSCRAGPLSLEWHDLTIWHTASPWGPLAGCWNCKVLVESGKCELSYWEVWENYALVGIKGFFLQWMVASWRRVGSVSR